MAERGGMWLERVAGAAGAMAAVATAWLSVSPGGDKAARPPLDEDDDDYNPLNEPEEEEGLPPAIEALFGRLGLRESGAYERAEGYYAMYRVMKSLGFSDADIAKLALQRAGASVDEGLEKIRPTDARGVFEAMEDAALRAAAEIDERFSLRGDLIRTVREGALAARAGREDALIGLERGLTQGREFLKRMLSSLSPGDER